MRNDADKKPIRAEIAKLSTQMKPLRRELRLYKDVAERSGVIEQIVEMVEFPQDKQRAAPPRKVGER